MTAKALPVLYSINVQANLEGSLLFIALNSKDPSRLACTLMLFDQNCCLLIFSELFVCVEVLRPSQPNGVMSSAVNLPNRMFTGHA